MTKKIIDKLNTAFLPQNLECDGAYCTGCWKDVIRESIKMIEEYDQQTKIIKANLENALKTVKALSNQIDEFNGWPK